MSKRKGYNMDSRGLGRSQGLFNVANGVAQVCALPSSLHLAPLGATTSTSGSVTMSPSSLWNARRHGFDETNVACAPGSRKERRPEPDSSWAFAHRRENGLSEHLVDARRDFTICLLTKVPHRADG